MAKNDCGSSVPVVSWVSRGIASMEFSPSGNLNVGGCWRGLLLL